MRKVLITGGAGYLGSVAIKRFLEHGYFVRIIDPLIFGKEQLNEVMNHPNFDLQVGLTEDKYMLEKCLSDIDCILHLSGLSNDPSCELNSALTEKINVDATKVLLQLCKEYNIERLIYASSCSVYGFTEGKVVNEESELNPLTAYAKSKVICEKLLIEEANDDLTVACMRKATLYGPSPRMRFDLVVNTMTGMAVSEKKIVINGGEQWRPFIHVDDAVRAYIFMMEAEKEKINRQIFNLGSNEENYMIIDIARRIAELIPEAEVIQSHSPDTRSYRVSFDKLNQLGWKTKYTIDDGILGVKEMFEKKIVTDFRDLNYFNIKRMLSYLNI